MHVSVRLSTASQMAKTRTFPQELVDEVVDELADPSGYPIQRVATCSLVSRALVTRTQKYHFQSIYLCDLGGLGKRYRPRIAPPPAN